MPGAQHPLAKKKYFTAFTGYENQQSYINAMDNLEAQYFQMYGLPLDYFPQTVDITKDAIFGEDETKKYERKHQLTAILKDSAVEETLQINGFGSLNFVQFSMYIHIATWKRLVGQEHDPLPGDIFVFPHRNSNLKFQVSHVLFSTLGTDGNFFGFRSCYELVCKEAELNPSSEGRGEQYGVVDAEGNIVPDAPSDVLVDDNSGRIRDKYNVPGPNPPGPHKGDNEQITIEEKPAGVIEHRRDVWGDW